MATLLATTASAQTLYDRFFDEYYFPFNPTSGTATGFHAFDSQLEDYSKAGVAKRIAVLKKFEGEFSKQPASPDRDLVLNSIHAGLLELETIRMWERNPDNYSSGITSSAYVIMSRTFAPPETRLKSLTARERLMPKVLADARTNLKNPPRIYTEVAIEQMQGNISFFKNDVPLAFKAVTDASLLKDFHAANDAVIAALGDYEKWLKQDLLPRSKGDFRLGAANYSKKLLYDEMVDIPLDRLLTHPRAVRKDFERALLPLVMVVGYHQCHGFGFINRQVEGEPFAASASCAALQSNRFGLLALHVRVTLRLHLARLRIAHCCSLEALLAFAFRGKFSCAGFPFRWRK